ncbi:MAG: hypothetical protein K1X53_04285 [Candidatus Sumerlaeaceae bacterium]|nr:hypothetical protein [Candidatus Sumerlaeaceae bacterium]
MTSEPQLATRGTFAGLFLVALATLMYEILLTRIFSVTMWYHFAFMAISIALFGMTVGAVVVYLRPAFFSADRTPRLMALSAMGFSVTSVLSFLGHLAIPFHPDLKWSGVLPLALNYTVISLPFVLSGICVCLSLTRFPSQVGRLYAADLVGAALGCILLVLALRVADAPSVVFIVAALGAASAVFYAGACDARGVQALGVLLVLGLGGFAANNAYLASDQAAPLRLIRTKGSPEVKPLYEKWNSFSRIAVHGDPKELVGPFGWGLSETCPAETKVNQLKLRIDASALTVLTGFDGDVNKLDFLKYDIVNLGHHMRPNSNVFVVGAGGGRDVLSALAFKQKSVTAIEINGNIIETGTKVFGDFTGHLDRIPGVNFINDEARSYISRSKDSCDILQVSLIDTWAATSSGAFVLSENPLYTLEGWRIFLSRLSDNGILTFSRWYFRDRPAEMYRLTVLATQALLDAGVKDPRQHLLIARRMYGQTDSDTPDGVGTLILSKKPFSAADIATFDRVTSEMKFQRMLMPSEASDEMFARIANGRDLAELERTFSLNISPPTDDNPFFFHMLRMGDALRLQRPNQGAMTFNVKAMVILALLLAVVTVLTALCILLPLALTAKSAPVRGAGGYLAYFAAIGLGFMLIEISLMQRLTIFLGHPTYSLSVLLFTILLATGAGSQLSQSVLKNVDGKGVVVAVAMIPVVALLIGLGGHPFIQRFESADTVTRIGLAVLLLVPLGLSLGMAFPLGMRIALATRPDLSPWLWGINGATSVLASVLAVVIAIGFRISAAYFCGVVCYVIALLALAAMRRNLTQATD